MSKIRHDGKGVLTDHDGDPIKCGESVISEELWNLRVKKMVSQDIDNEKDDDWSNVLKTINNQVVI